jgi:hypothetical protein
MFCGVWQVARPYVVDRLATDRSGLGVRHLSRSQVTPASAWDTVIAARRTPDSSIRRSPDSTHSAVTRFVDDIAPALLQRSQSSWKTSGAASTQGDHRRTIVMHLATSGALEPQLHGLATRLSTDVIQFALRLGLNGRARRSAPGRWPWAAAGGRLGDSYAALPASIPRRWADRCLGRSISRTGPRRGSRRVRHAAAAGH